MYVIYTQITPQNARPFLDPGWTGALFEEKARWGVFANDHNRLSQNFGDNLNLNEGAVIFGAKDKRTIVRALAAASQCKITSDGRIAIAQGDYHTRLTKERVKQRLLSLPGRGFTGIASFGISMKTKKYTSKHQVETEIRNGDLRYGGYYAMLVRTQDILPIPEGLALSFMAPHMISASFVATALNNGKLAEYKPSWSIKNLQDKIAGDTFKAKAFDKFTTWLTSSDQERANAELQNT